MLTEHNVEYWKIKCICFESIWIRVLVESAPWSGWVFMSRFPYNVESELLELNVKINKEHFLTTVVQKLSQSDSEILKYYRFIPVKPLSARNEFKSMSDRIFDFRERRLRLWGTRKREQNMRKWQNFYLKSYTYISWIVWCVLLLLRRNNQSLITFLIQEHVDIMHWEQSCDVLFGTSIHPSECIDQFPVHFFKAFFLFCVTIRQLNPWEFKPWEI